MGGEVPGVDPSLPSVTWKTLSITHVEYPEGDILGKIFAIYSLMPLVIMIMLFTLFMSRRDLHTATLGVGVILNHILNQVLKKMYAEPRPMQRAVTFEEHGWPSNHSQYMWFVCSYLILFIKYRLHHLGGCQEIFWKTMSSILCLGGAVTMSYSRVYLQYHTEDQVVAGSVIGSVAALFWFLVTQKILTPLFPMIASWRISEVFMIRDCTPIPNIMWFEFVSTRGEYAARKKKERKVQ